MKVFRKITAVTLSIMLLTGMVMIAAQAAEPQMVISIDQTGVAGDENNRISESETLSPGEVITRKSVRDLEDGTFEITLEAVGRRFEQVTEIESPVQFDVVFVLDYSTSMDDNNKYDNMRTAAADTINKIVERNTSEYYNRVAVVKYANGASTLVNWTTDTITTQKLASTREARTNIMSGMNQAYKLLAARTGNDANRPAIIVLMTDGQPNGYYDDATLTSNTTTANQKTSGSTADANLTSVVKTIQNMAHIKALMPGNIVENGEAYNKLSIYTVGFGLMSFSGAQKAYAYAVMNPEPSTALSPTSSTSQINGDSSSNKTAYISAMNNVRTELAKLSGYVNPVSATQDASANLNDIAKAFTKIIETITYDDPLNGNISLFDQIDDTFSVDMSSFVRNGVALSPSDLAACGISLNNGELRWNFRLASFYNISEDAVAVGENFISTLRFTVSAKVSAEYLERTSYTNTSNYNDNTASSKNRAEFTPLDENPFYRNSNGAKVVHPLRATGWVTLIHTYEMPEIEISLGKVFEANRENASKLPGTVESFEFALALQDSTVVATLKLTNENNTASGIFTWTSSATFEAVENQVLYLTESLPATNWRGLINGQDLTEGRVAFVKVNSDASVTYLQNNINTVTNIFNQSPEPLAIYLRKFFVGDLDSFNQLHQFDPTTHTHTSSCYEAMPVDCDGCENCMVEAEEQMLTKYDDMGGLDLDSKNQDAGTDDANAITVAPGDAIIEVVSDETTDVNNDAATTDGSADSYAEDANTETGGNETTSSIDSTGTFVGADFHVNTQCYEWVLKEDCDCTSGGAENECYSFSFKLLNKNASVIGEETISLTAEEIISLMNNESSFVQADFQIPVSELGNGPFEIIENNIDHIGWTQAAPISGIVVPELGGANIRALTYEMTNTFGGFFVPEIAFGKEVIDTRLGNTDESYVGRFEFNIRGTEDFATLNNTATVSVQAGFGHWNSRFINYLNATGSIIVTESNTAIAGMDYDSSELTFNFVDGQLISVMKDMQEAGKESDAVFSNNYQEPRNPKLVLTKLTNEGSPDDQFTFVVEDDNGAEISVIKMGKGSQNVALDTNFTGTIKVKEINEGAAGWTYDEREITLTYEDGLLIINSPEGEISVGLIGAATFVNTYEKPDISHPPVIPSKAADPEDGNNHAGGDDRDGGDEPEDGEEPESNESAPVITPIFSSDSESQYTSSNGMMAVETFSLENSSVPLSEMMINDSEVPLSDFRPEKEFELADTDDSDETEVTITDDSIPLGMMPQTGVNNNTGSPLLGLIISVLATLGLGGLISRIKRDEKNGK